MVYCSWTSDALDLLLVCSARFLYLLSKGCRGCSSFKGKLLQLLIFIKYQKNHKLTGGTKSKHPDLLRQSGALSQSPWSERPRKMPRWVSPTSRNPTAFFNRESQFTGAAFHCDQILEDDMLKRYSNRKGWESSNQLVNVLDTFSWCQAVCSVYINVLIDSTSAFTKCILYGCMYVCIHDHACMYIHNYVYTLYRTINTIRTVYRSMLESLYSWKKRIKQAFTEQSVKIPPSIVPCFAPETWSRPFSPL